MNNIPVIKHDSLDNATSSIAKEVQSMVESTLDQKYWCTFGLVGGQSVSNIYKKLLEYKIDYSKLKFYLLDERLVEPESEESNYNLVYNALFAPLLASEKITKENIRTIDYSKILEPRKIIHDYIDQFKKDTLSSHVIDVAIISMGEDGHIASVFPNNSSFYDASGLFIVVKNAPKDPPKRISASKRMLSNINNAILLAFGESKKEALENFLKKTYDNNLCPARILKNIPNIKVFTDINL